MADTDPIRLFDTTTGELIMSLPTTGDQGRRIEVVNELMWTDTHLTLQYNHSYHEDEQAWPEATLRVTKPKAVRSPSEE